MGDDGPNGRVSFADAVRHAQDLVEALAGKPAEGVSGVRQGEHGGWTVSLDVVELSRIPPSTDVLATYEVELDGGGELVDFTRIRRYVRNQSDEE